MYLLLCILAQTQGGRTFTKNASSTSISDGCDRNNCDHIKLKRIPNVHRAVAVACDIKGTNFCVIQVNCFLLRGFNDGLGK